MEKIIIEKENSGIRVDKFLAKEFFLYSRGEIVRKIKNGLAKVNGKTIKPSYVLEENDCLILKSFSREPENKELVPNNEIDLEIIFENPNIIVVNKPAGLQVHPSHNEKKETLVNALLAKYPEIKDVHDESEGASLRPGIIHRLDKDTSGVIVIARNSKSFVELKALFKKREIEKTYLAIVGGIFNEKEGKIDRPIARSSSYKKQVIARNNTKTIIRNAETQYKVVGEYDNLSLVEVKPKTGRMHQIRIHLSSVGHPIIGDRIYGKSALEETKRQLLHAQKISLDLFGEKYSFEALLPADFKEFLEKITLNKAG